MRRLLHVSGALQSPGAVDGQYRGELPRRWVGHNLPDPIANVGRRGMAQAGVLRQLTSRRKHFICLFLVGCQFRVTDLKQAPTARQHGKLPCCPGVTDELV
jgi:hypothetical protein